MLHLLSFLLDNYNNGKNPTFHWSVGFLLSLACLGGVFLVIVQTHANHYADWCGANTVTQPKGLPLAEGDFKWAVPVTIHTS